jgi:hemoglobin-like flavoprotein
LTEVDVAHIGRTFTLIETRGDDFAVLFYNHLFEIADVKHMFKEKDVTKQGRKLIAMLKTAIKFIRSPETLVPTLEQLGIRHIDYGVRPEHYAPVGASLVWTLEKMLSRNDLNEEAMQAWVKVYTLMADTCIKAANDHEKKMKCAKATSEIYFTPSSSFLMIFVAGIAAYSYWNNSANAVH